MQENDIPVYVNTKQKSECSLASWELNRLSEKAWTLSQINLKI